MSFATGLTGSVVMMMVVMMMVVVMVVEVEGQRAPCCQCEMYRDAHPNSRPYNAIRERCVYPCECGPVPRCPEGVALARDGCGCCWQCARQVGEGCDTANNCDGAKNLTCVYANPRELSGVCQENQATKVTVVGCHINNRSFEHGETYSPDCRTQCSCQNGTYACVSLCPNESLRPSEQCHNPHLVTVTGQCCREWMCDAPDRLIEPPSCEHASGRWSQCSESSCGVGISVRWSTDNPLCQLVNQTRLCQVRPCEDFHRQTPQEQQLQQVLMGLPGSRRALRKHHIRRSHLCKATLRPTVPLRLRVGWCVSARRYRPKKCAACQGRCCAVHTSTTLSITFICPLHANTDLLSFPHGNGIQTANTPRSRQPNGIFTTNNARYRSPYQPQPPTTTTTSTLSVYDMMDEGQPIQVAEAVLTDPREYNDVWSATENGDDSDPDAEVLPLPHENLTTEDDYLYDEIKEDSYETVQYQVEWIMRCKCEEKCTQPNQGPPPPLPPTPTQPSTPLPPSSPPPPQPPVS